MTRAHYGVPTAALTLHHNLQAHEIAHDTLCCCAGETCEVNLTTDVIKWILPPGLRSTMAPELMDESDREYRPCLTPSSRGRLLGSGSGGRVSAVSLPAMEVLLPGLVKLHAHLLVPWPTFSSETAMHFCCLSWSSCILGLDPWRCPSAAGDRLLVSDCRSQVTHALVRLRASRWGLLRVLSQYLVVL